MTRLASALGGVLFAGSRNWMKDWGTSLKVEWGGRVCKDKSKEDCYSCTSPITMNDVENAPTSMSPCPAGTEDVGFYHNHPSGNLLSIPDLSKAGWTGEDYRAYVWRSGGDDWRVQVWRLRDGYSNPDGSPNFGKTIGTVRPSKR